MYVRSFSQSGLGRYGLGDTARVQAEVTAAANRYGVDPSLALLIAQHESGFNQYGKNGKVLQSTLANGQPGALGVMQLMPATAAGLNVDPNDELQNIDGGVRLLSQLLKEWNGNVQNAVAAYSAGSGAVRKYGGVPPYKETQDYVAFINANYSGPGSVAPSSSPDSSSSLPDYSSPDSSPSPAWYASFLPGSDSETQFDIGGVVLSASDLLLVGGAIVGVIVLRSIL